MGGNIGGGHDSRLIDLMVALMLLAAIVVAWSYFGSTPATPPTTTAFIVPGQSTRW